MDIDVGHILHYVFGNELSNGCNIECGSQLFCAKRPNIGPSLDVCRIDKVAIAKLGD